MTLVKSTHFNLTHSVHSTWTGMVPVDDTALAVNDSRGNGQAVVYLNGAYASQRHWRPVIAELGADWRHVTFDERARGRSKRSADYSFEACVRDLDAVLDATGVDRPLLVGWSYGAAVAVHWAARHPERVVGVVSVDGALPYDASRDIDQEQIRRLFHRMRWLLPLARPLGLTARMSADQHAAVNIEILEICAAIAPVLECMRCPVRFVLATGAHMGGDEEVMRKVRASLDPVLTRNPDVRISATVPSNHSHVLSKSFTAIAAAVREIANARDQEIS